MRLRDRLAAAILCSTRASAEASPYLWLSDPDGNHRSNGPRYVVWSPANWTTEQRKLAKRAFDAAVAKNGVGFQMAPVNWAEAECMIRCGEIE